MRIVWKKSTGILLADNFVQTDINCASYTVALHKQYVETKLLRQNHVCIHPPTHKLTQRLPVENLPPGCGEISRSKGSF